MSIYILGYLMVLGARSELNSFFGRNQPKSINQSRQRNSNTTQITKWQEDECACLPLAMNFTPVVDCTVWNRSPRLYPLAQCTVENDWLTRSAPNNLGVVTCTKFHHHHFIAMTYTIRCTVWAIRPRLRIRSSFTVYCYYSSFSILCQQWQSQRAL